jgi:hypothetical protein
MTAPEADAGVLGWLRRHIELIIVIVLSVATLTTSWAGYQAALWGGVQATSFGRAATGRAKAVRVASRADQQESIDIFLFSQWLNAYAADDQRLQAFYRARFRPEFAPAFEAWLAMKPYQTAGAPPTPFVTRRYRLATREEAIQADREADDIFQAGQGALHTSEAFVGATVILTSAMFFGGISQAFKNRTPRLVLAAISILTCAWGVIEVLNLTSH